MFGDIPIRVRRSTSLSKSLSSSDGDAAAAVGVSGTAYTSDSTVGLAGTLVPVEGAVAIV